MADTHHAQGPGKSVLGIGQRIGLMSLMVLIIWAVDPQYRLNAMIATTVVLLLLALIGGIWTLRKSRKSTLLRHTRHELANDRQLLEEESREQ